MCPALSVRYPPGHGATARRRRIVAGVVVLVAVALVALVPWTALALLLLAVRTSVRLDDTRGVAVAAAAAAVGGALLAAVAPDTAPSVYDTALLVVLSGVLPWLGGRAWRQRRQLQAVEEQALERMQREHQLVAEQARLRERARLAEDLHDGLGHDLSVVALRAGALEVAPDLTQAERATAAGEVRSGVTSAMERLTAVVDVLHNDADAAPLQPAPSRIDEVVDRAHESGLQATLSSCGTAPDTVAASVQQTAARVVQEGLTNAARHAPGAAIDVIVSWRPDTVHLDVINGPATRAGHPGGGRGLHGLRERARLVGGWLHAEQHHDGFRLSAELPIVGSDTPPQPTPTEAVAVTSDLPDLQQVRRMRRRNRRRAVTAITAGLAAMAALVAAQVIVVASADAVLPADDYRGLQPGQQRATVEQVLPAEQAANRPDTTAGGAQCRFYAVTANPLDDRYGDLYRLCFNPGQLASKEIIVDGNVSDNPDAR